MNFSSVVTKWYNSSLSSVLEDNLTDWHPEIQYALYLRCAVFGVGLVLNCLLIYVTWKHKFLHGRCNLLIALDAFLSAIFQAYSLGSTIIIFIGFRYINFGTCCILLQPIAFLANYSTQVVVMMIALDRLSAILFPIWYRTMTKKKKQYLLVLVALSGLNGIPYLYCYFNSPILVIPYNTQVICFATTCLINVNISYISQVGNVLYIVCIVAYVVFFVAYRMKNAKITAASSNADRESTEVRRLFKALVSMFCFYLLVILLNFSVPVYSNIGLSPSVFRVFSQSNLLLKWFLIGMNPVLLYTFSKEYRKAFDSFGTPSCVSSIFSHGNPTTNSVQPVSNLTRPQPNLSVVSISNIPQPIYGVQQQQNRLNLNNTITTAPTGVTRRTRTCWQ